MLSIGGEWDAQIVEDIRRMVADSGLDSDPGARVAAELVADGIAHLRELRTQATSGQITGEERRAVPAIMARVLAGLKFLGLDRKKIRSIDL